MANVGPLVVEQWALIVVRRVGGPTTLATLTDWTTEAGVAFGRVRLLRALERLEHKGQLVRAQETGPKGGKAWRVRGEN